MENDEIKVQLAGFHDIDESAMDIINKTIATHSKKIARLAKDAGLLHITLKKVHEREKGEIYDIHVKLPDIGKVYVSHLTDRNLLAAVDKALEKITNEMD